MPYLLAILRNRQFWIGFGILILIIILINQWGNIGDWYKRKTQTKDIDLTPEEKERLIKTGKALSNSTKNSLEELAQLLHSDIYDTPILGHDSDLYTRSMNLSDTELKFMAKYYRENISKGVYLEEDIDNEIYSPFTNIDSRLIARLAKVGEKSF